MSEEVDLAALEQVLLHVFLDKQLAERALTHSSYAFEARVADNERLEFLGDAVLQTAASMLLFDRFPDAPEDALSRMRAALVRTERVAETARQLDLARLVRLGYGEDTSGGRQREALLADTVEAVLGALLLDAGFDACRAQVARWYEPDLVAFVGQIAKGGYTAVGKDAKSLLQELTQARHQTMPTYREESREGPPHRPVFRIGVHLGDRLVAVGTGNSKDAASHDAARQALATLTAPEEP